MLVERGRLFHLWGMSEGSQKRETGTAPGLAAIAAVLAFLLYAPRWIFGRVCFPNDLYIHYNWATFFFERWAAGCLKPEWLPEVFNGLGAPVFAYYPPGYFALAGLFRWLAGDMWAAMRLAEGAAAAAMGWTAWLHVGGSAAKRALVGLAVCAAPYGLATLSLGGGMPAYVSGALVLFALARCGKLLGRPTGRFDAPLAVAAGLIPWTHNLALFLGAVALCGGLALARIVCAGTGKQIRWIAISAAAGAALGSGHLATALAGSGAINMSNLVDILDWRAGFATPIFSKVDWFAFQWGIGGYLVLGYIALLATWKSSARGARRTEAAFWIGATGISLFFATELSWPLWAALPPLQHFQFPTRFFQPASLALAMGLGHALGEEGGRRWARGLAWMGLSAGLALSAAFAAKTALCGEPARARMEGFAQSTSGQWEYLPAGQPLGWRGVGSIEPGRIVELDGGRVEVLEPGRCGGMRAKVRRGEAGAQRLPALGHPRFRAKANGEAAGWAMDGASGLVRMELEGGETLVEMEWSRGWPQALSLAGLGALLLTLPIWAATTRRRAMALENGENVDGT